MKIQTLRARTLPLAAAIFMAGTGLVTILLMPRAQAAAFTNATVRIDRLIATTATGGRVCIVPSTAATENKLIVRFPTTAATDFVVNTTAANWTTNSTFESGFTYNGGAVSAMPITGNVASSVTGKDVTFTLSTDLVVGTSYCFNFSATNTLTTSSAGAAVSVFAYVETQTAASAQIDKSFWGVTIVSNDTVTVTAVVAPYFTMALNGSTDTFATNLSPTSINTSNGNRTVQVDTNGLNGWIMWVKGTNFKTVTDTGSNPANRHGALTSVTAGGYAISNNTTNSLNSASHAFVGAGPEDYGLATTINTDAAGGGTVSLNAAYNGTVAGNAGVIDSTQYRSIATANGTSAGDILNLRMLVTITASTPPGADYTDTLTYVGAGQF